MADKQSQSQSQQSQGSDETRVTQSAGEAGGVDVKQVQPTRGKSGKDVKASLAFQPDADLHPDGDPPKSADQSSYPGGEAEIHDPPIRSTKPDVGIIRTLATGAGAHVPPDPDVYTPEGRVRDEQ